VKNSGFIVGIKGICYKKLSSIIAKWQLLPQEQLNISSGDVGNSLFKLQLLVWYCKLQSSWPLCQRKVDGNQRSQYCQFCAIWMLCLLCCCHSNICVLSILWLLELHLNIHFLFQPTFLIFKNRSRRSPGIYITAPVPISMMYFINPSHQSVCPYVYSPLSLLGKGSVNTSMLQQIHATIEELLGASSSMQSMGY
jgi:hypothetical protein